MAFENLVRPWSSERTLHRDASFCIVDKPAGVACGPGTGVTPVPGALPERLALHGLGALVTVLPVPQRASGATLMSFATDAASSPRLSGRLPEPLQAVTCVVAVDDCRLPLEGQLRSLSGDPMLGLEYRVLRRQSSRALVEARGSVAPDQVARVFAKHGQAIVGDDAAGAPAATRLMLHVSGLTGGLHARAPLPVEFESWLIGAAVQGPERFASALCTAAVSRFALGRCSDAFRLIGEEAGEISGITVDRYGDFAVLSISSEGAWAVKEQLADCLMDHGARGVYLKRRVRTDLRAADASLLAPSLPLRGSPAPESLCVRQAFAKFCVRLDDGLATGLFLDQRANWERVSHGAGGSSLLNLFCYTGAFTLAAAAGGAASTVSVDLATRALGRLRENLELNELSGPQHRLLKHDVLSWLARARRGPRRFDFIVLDPPSFGTRAQGVLSTERDGPGLIAGAASLLESRGHLLCVSHHRKLTASGLAEVVTKACAARGLSAKVEAWVAGWDCPTLPGVSATKSVLARLQ